MHAAELAVGRWLGILVHFGIDRTLLSGRHSPCPVCEGRDRFRFDDKEGRGTFFCSHCGAGDGFKLLSLVKGWSFKQSATEIEGIVGTIAANTAKVALDASNKVEVCRRMWRESKAVVAGDPAHSYLIRRIGITEVPDCIRFHAALTYRRNDGSVTRHPAMLARVTGFDGQGVAIHRTYLNSAGEKADVPTIKKIVGTLPASSTVRLHPAARCMGIAEGIETALSASLLFSIPVWAAISAGGLEKWTPPFGTQYVTVFGDNDKNGTGQAASWSLAKRLITSGIDVNVRIPETLGHDWNDILQLGRSE
jgi:putative DNA primase/helicase